VTALKWACIAALSPKKDAPARSGRACRLKRFGGGRVVKLVSISQALLVAGHLSFSEWAGVFGDARMSTALLARLIHHCHILETGNDSFRFKAGAAASKTRKEKSAA